MLCDAPAGWISVALGYAGMMYTNARDYRRRAKDCCRKAVILEDIDQRSHWLEAARAGTHLPVRKALCHLKHQARTRRSNQGETK